MQLRCTRDISREPCHSDGTHVAQSPSAVPCRNQGPLAQVHSRGRLCHTGLPEGGGPVVAIRADHAAARPLHIDRVGPPTGVSIAWVLPSGGRVCSFAAHGTSQESRAIRTGPMWHSRPRLCRAGIGVLLPRCTAEGGCATQVFRCWEAAREGQRTVATGGAERNPWKTGDVNGLPRQGQRTVATGEAERNP